MRNNGSKMIAAAFLLILIGAILFVVGMTGHGWDFSLLNTVKYETNTHEINDEFNKIKIDTDISDIFFELSDDDTCRVVCYEEEDLKHSVSVQDETLTITCKDDRTWFARFGIAFDSPKVTVYLPKTEYSSLTIKGSTGDITLPKDFNFGSADLELSTGDIDCRASLSGVMRIHNQTGDIRLEGLSAKELDLAVSTGHVNLVSVSCEGNISISVSTGKTRMTDVSCNSITSDGSTGDITLKNVIAKEKITIERDTGDVEFDGCDAEELDINTETGDVKGTLLSEKKFIAQSDTGNVRVPETITGGKCMITTDTGDIKIEIR